MVFGLPWKQSLLLLMIFVFSFATIYWGFYELGFPSTFFVVVIVIIASFGLTSVVYNLIFRLSRTIYSREFKNRKIGSQELRDLHDSVLGESGEEVGESGEEV